MRVTENGIYYMNRAVVGKAQRGFKNQRSHQAILMHWGG